MALSKDEIIEAIAALSVTEVVELVKAMEEKFGVSAAAAVAAAPAGGAATLHQRRLKPLLKLQRQPLALLP